MSSSVHGAGKVNSTPEIRIYTATRRACDCCRLRKIRCDSLQPCNNCRKSSAPCLYLDVPKKTGPRRKSTKSTETALKKVVSFPDVQACLPATGLPLEALSLPSNGPFSLINNIEDCSEDVEALSAKQCASGSMTSNGKPLIPCTVDSPVICETFLDNPLIRVPPIVLLPFLEMFFNHLFPIMPVLDREVYLNFICYQDSIPPDEYCLITAVSAVTIVQLNLPPTFVEQSVPGLTAELLVEQCLQERCRYDYIDEPTASTVLISFFLFGYYGNLEKHNTACYYLHEAISFAEVVGLDDEDHLAQMAPVEGQWCRRVFWLLFVTERGYALQRQNQVRLLNTTVKLPSSFQSEDSRLLRGFVDLANLFLSIDETFLAVWNGRGKEVCCSKDWLMEIQQKLNSAPSISVEKNIETQQLDISISRRWLQVLAWQISVKQGLLMSNSHQGPFDLRYPIELAKDVVKLTSTADQMSLGSHGIGMEQKLADVANCLADVLTCTEGDTSKSFYHGREYLFALLHQLSRIRGLPSRYLQPLLEKTDSLRSQIPLRSLPIIGWDVTVGSPATRNEEENQFVDIPHSLFPGCVA